MSGLPTTFEEAREIVLGTEAFRQKAHEAASAALRGVRRVGYDLPDFRPMTDAEVAAEAHRKLAAATAWLQGPRRQLCRAIRELDEIGYGEEAYKLESTYRAQLADEREPLNVAAVGACLAILGNIEHPTAREGVMALSELLMGERNMKDAA